MRDVFQFTVIFLFIVLMPHVLMEIVLMSDHKSFVYEMNRMLLSKNKKIDRQWRRELAGLVCMNALLAASCVAWLVCVGSSALEQPTIINVALLASIMLILAHQLYAIGDELIDLLAGWGKV